MAVAHTYLVLGALVLAACQKSTPQTSKTAATTAPAGSEAREVRTALAQSERFPRTVTATGELAPFEAATLATKVAGRLERIDVDVGARVAKGAPIAAIETRDLELRIATARALVAAARARLGLSFEGDGDDVVAETAPLVRAAQAELDDAKRSHERIVALQEGGVESQASFDTAEARLRTAESDLQDALEEIQNRRAVLAQRRAELAQAEQALADAGITAPFDGAIAERLAGTGDYLPVGASVARLVRFDPLRVKLTLSERDAAQVEVGQALRVRVEGESEPRTARIVRASPEIDSRSRTLAVEAELSNPDGRVRAGAFARAEILLGEDEVVAVPLESLVVFAGVEKVLLVRDGAVEERRVTTGRRLDGRVEIVSGLAAGDEVVVAPGNLQGGARVRTASK